MQMRTRVCARRRQGLSLVCIHRTRSTSTEAHATSASHSKKNIISAMVDHKYSNNFRDLFNFFAVRFPPCQPFRLSGDGNPTYKPQKREHSWLLRARAKKRRPLVNIYSPNTRRLRRISQMNAKIRGKMARASPRNGFEGVVWQPLNEFRREIRSKRPLKASTHLRGSGAVQRRYHLTLHGTASVPLQIRASVWRP